MIKRFEFCLPTRATSVPDGPDWLHEVKYDGYRLRLERDGDRVRLITRGGYNWTDCYPWIVETARKVRQKRFVLDGEAVILGVDDVSDFNALHSRRHDHEVQFCAFDRRAEQRRPVRKAGMIEFPGGAFSCMVQNLSDAGAALASSIGIPEHFTLMIVERGDAVQCRSVWRTERQIGVAFETAG